MLRSYFWRRAFAYLIDIFVYYFIFSVVAIAIAFVLPIQVIVPAFIHNTSCQPIPVDRDHPVISEMHPPSNAEIYAELCVVRQLFVHNVYSARFGYKTNDAGRKLKVESVVPINRDGNVIFSIDLSDLAVLLLPFVSAAFLAKRGATPGKEMLDLTVLSERREEPTYRKALIRELVRLSPLILISLVSLVGSVSGAFTSSAIYGLLQSGKFTIGGLLALIAIFCILHFWLWFGSFIRWNGQAYWDRITGLYTIYLGVSRTMPPKQTELPPLGGRW